MNYFLRISEFHNSEAAAHEEQSVSPSPAKIQFEEFPCTAEITAKPVPEGVQLTVTATFTQAVESANLSFGARVSDWDKSNYVFAPGAVYNGNRFHSEALPYPPYFYLDKPDIITDIPHLSAEARESRIQMLSGDMASPLCGFYARRGESLALLTHHRCHGASAGFTMLEDLARGCAEFVVSVPGVREKTQYFFGDLRDGKGFRPTREAPSHDSGHSFAKGESLTFSVCVFAWQGITLQEYFEKINRVKTTLEHAEPFTNVPFYKAYKSIKEKYQRCNYTLEGYYATGTDWKQPTQCWQAGWIGGGMSSYPFLLEDSGEAAQRAVSTLHFIFSHLQHPNGWVYGMYGNGKFYGDGGDENPPTILLVRKDADLLYFVVKQLFFLAKTKRAEAFEAPVRALCDAFVRLYQRHGQLGQFIDIATEEIVVGESAGACMAVAALALAGSYFNDALYLDTAKRLGHFYNENYLKKGMLNGCPGEICQAPDSEAAFAMLESMVQLFEATGDDLWLTAAKEAGEIAATWVMSYDYQFPPQSTAALRGAHSGGTVFANAQNKHSAPGICTLSGDSLLRLYRFTGDTVYLRRLAEIAHSIPQFVSIPENPVFTLEKEFLPDGFVNERVQTSDWEGKETVGEFLYGSNWPEVSMLLTFVEVPGVYVDFSSQTLQVFDHIECSASWAGDRVKLTLYNPTEYGAIVSIFADDHLQKKLPHGLHNEMKHVAIAAHNGICTELEFKREVL